MVKTINGYTNDNIYMTLTISYDRQISLSFIEVDWTIKELYQN